MTHPDAPRPPRQPGGRKGPWSHPEIERLRRLYGLRTEAQIARSLRRSPQSVKRMVHKVFSGEPRNGPWTAKEVGELKKYLGAASMEVIARILRRSESEVARQVTMLQGEIREREWTSGDVQDLKRLFGTRSTDDLALILGRPVVSIESKAAEFCLAKDKGYARRAGRVTVRMPRWQTVEIERLRELYPETPNLEIARIIQRTEKSIVSKAHDLGLKKSTERLRLMGQQNVSVRYESDEDSAEAGG